MAETKVTKDVEAKVLTIERVFDAPREKVWQAYTNGDALEAWWGPEGWQTTNKKFEFKPGGVWHYGMKCVDENQGEWFGQESWGMATYKEIDEPNSFTYVDAFADADGNPNTDMPSTTITVEFHDEGGKTRLVSRGVYSSPEALEQVVDMGMIEGTTSTLDRLDQWLARG